MFGNKKLESKIDTLIQRENRNFEIMQSLVQRIDNLAKDNKAQYAWSLRKEEVELMENGKKVKKIREIL